MRLGQLAQPVWTWDGVGRAGEGTGGWRPRRGLHRATLCDKYMRLMRDTVTAR